MRSSVPRVCSIWGHFFIPAQKSTLIRIFFLPEKKPTLKETLHRILTNNDSRQKAQRLFYSKHCLSNDKWILNEKVLCMEAEDINMSIKGPEYNGSSP